MYLTVQRLPAPGPLILRCGPEGKATPAERSPGRPPCSSAGTEGEAGATGWGLGRGVWARSSPAAEPQEGAPCTDSTGFRDPVTEELRQTAPPKGQVLVTSWLSPFSSLFSYPRGQSGQLKQTNKPTTQTRSIVCAHALGEALPPHEVKQASTAGPLSPT